MLIDHLRRLDPGHWLYCWAGKLLDSEHASVRADLVRLRAFRARGKGRWLYREIPPYRPTAVSKASSSGDELHKLMFADDPVLVIRSGARKGRHAHSEDLYRTEDASRIDISVELSGENPLDVQDRQVAHSLEICETCMESYEAAGGKIENIYPAYIPRFLLSSKRSAHVYVRPELDSTKSPPAEEYGGFVLRDANWWYGQGVWCVDPGDLGHWYISSNLDNLQHGYEVAVSE